MDIATLTAFEEELGALRKTSGASEVLGSAAKWYAGANPVTKAMLGFAALGATLGGLKGAQDTDPVYNSRTGNIQNPNLIDRFNRTASGAARGAVGGAAGAALTGFLLGKFKKAADLTQASRDRVKEKNFAIPETRRYPIHDAAHARNALARVSQHGTSDEKARVRAAVARKWPGVVGPDTKQELKKD